MSDGRRPIPVYVVAGVYLAVGVIGFIVHWLAVAWIVFHVVLSAFGETFELLVHAILAVMITWLLFRPATARWFHPADAEPV